MTQTLTTERLKTIAAWRAKYGADHNIMIPAKEAEAMAHELLANREAQPVGFYTTVSGHKGIIWHNGAPEDDTAIYTAPPAPAVPRVSVIPEAATLTNINQLCPLDKDLSQTDFATGWNDCRQYALTHDGLPPVIKGIHAAAQGWNACRAAMLAQPVSQGYKLVPVEPTEDMIAAAMNCDDVEFNSDETFCVNFDNIYRAMIAAAPEGGNEK